LEDGPEHDESSLERWIGGQAELAASPELVKQIKRIYAHYSRLHGFLQQPPPEDKLFGSTVFRSERPEARTPEASARKTALLRPGSRIGRFTLVRFIARGGMGQVWEATDETLQAPVALKLLLPDRVDTRSLELFTREARAGGRLRHPNIVRTLSHGSDAGLTWIAQELVEGSWTLKDSLDDLRSQDALPREYYGHVATLVAQIADALEAAHDAGVVHRDVKPANILLERDDTPRLTDFGLARVSDDPFQSRTGEFAGTWAYMSPEQVTAKRMGLDSRTDVFSLGVVLYELLTLQRPFEGDTTHQIAEKIIAFEPPEPWKVRSQCPRELAVICLKALEKSPGRRYQSAAAFSSDIQAHLENKPISARRSGALTKAAKWVRRNPTKSWMTALSMILLASALGALLLNYQNNITLAEKERTAANESYVSALASAMRATQAGEFEEARALLDHCPPNLQAWEWRHVHRRITDNKKDVRFVPSAAQLFSNNEDPGGLAVKSASWGPGDDVILARLGKTRYLTVNLRTQRCTAYFQCPADSFSDAAWVNGVPMVTYVTGTGRVHTASLVKDKAVPSPIAVVDATGDIDRLELHPMGVLAALQTTRGETLILNLQDGKLENCRALPTLSVLRTSRARGSQGLAWHPTQPAMVSIDLSSASENGWEFVAWNALTGEDLLRLDPRIRPAWPFIGINDSALQYDAGGSTIAVQGIREFHFYHADSGALMFSVPDPLSGGSFAIRPDDFTLAVRSGDGVRVLDSRSGALKESTLLDLRDRGHSRNSRLAASARSRQLSSFSALDWSRDGSRVSMGYADGSGVAIWNVGNTQHDQYMDEHAGEVASISWLPNGHQLASGGHDGLVFVWDTLSGARIPGQVHEDWITDLKVSPTSSRIASSSFDRTVQITSVAPENRVREFSFAPQVPLCLGWLPDGKWLAIGLSSGQCFLAHDNDSTPSQLWLDVGSEPIIDLDCSSSGKSIACLLNDGKLALIDSTDGRRHWTREFRDGEPEAIAWSPMSPLIAVGFDTGTVLILDEADGRTVASLFGHRGPVTDLDWSPAEPRLVTCSTDESVRVWDQRTWHCVATLLGHQGKVSCASWSLDGMELASGSRDSMVFLWAQ